MCIMKKWEYTFVGYLETPYHFFIYGQTSTCPDLISNGLRRGAERHGRFGSTFPRVLVRVLDLFVSSSVVLSCLRSPRIKSLTGSPESSQTTDVFHEVD